MAETKVSLAVTVFGGIYQTNQLMKYLFSRVYSEIE